MNNSPKLFLQIYGLGRMILGISQIVGLTAGYFLIEWMIKYPPHTISFLLDQDLVLLVYLAIFLRGTFHIVAGIGIARTTSWVRSWLLYGWPIILLMIWGLIYSLASPWVEQHLINSVMEAISFPKLFFYLAFVAFDYTFVQINLVQVEKESQPEAGIDSKVIYSIFFSAVVFFILLLFVGKPIKQGFHKGYYKVGGDKTIEQMNESNKEVQTHNKAKQKIVQIEQKQTQEEMLLEQEALKKAAALALEKEPVKKEEPPKPPKDLNVPADVSSRALLGFLAALALMGGFVFQLLHVYRIQKVEGISAVAFLLLSLGFSLLLMYGMALKLLPMILAGFFCTGICVALFILRWKSKG